jgi:phage terminase small subunit
MGNPRKPIKLLRLQGTYRPGRHDQRAKTEPVAEGVLPVEPPAELGLSERQAWWYRHAVTHAPAGTIAPIDRPLLIVWATACADHEIASGQLSRILADDEPDFRLMRLYSRLSNQTGMLVLQTGRALGFSPAARAALGTTAVRDDKLPADSPWNRLRLFQNQDAEDAP